MLFELVCLTWEASLIGLIAVNNEAYKTVQQPMVIGLLFLPITNVSNIRKFIGYFIILMYYVLYIGDPIYYTMSSLAMLTENTDLYMFVVILYAYASLSIINNMPLEVLAIPSVLSLIGYLIPDRLYFKLGLF